MQTCKGKTKTGAACRAAAGSGGLCFFHANPDSVRTLGQLGGGKIVDRWLTCRCPTT